MRVVMSKMVSLAVSSLRGVSSVARGMRDPACRLLCCGGARPLSTPASVGGGGGLGEPSWGWYETLSSSVPALWMESGLVALQAASGLPWWATVIAASAVLRTGLTLPLAAQQGRVLAKLENLQPEIQSLAKRLRYEVSICAKQQEWSEKSARFYFKKNLKRIVSELYVRDNCHPFKATLLIWIQIPLWVFVSVALRNLSVGSGTSEGTYIQEQLSTGGTLWFMDLTVPDSTWILPIILGTLNLLIVEIFALRKTSPTKFQKYATNFFRGTSVFMIPVAATVPSVVFMTALAAAAEFGTIPATRTAILVFGQQEEP
ncbi:cytochrome c oxidase assembly protein COX18, mitochondrial-like isoform X2 [Varanus komodoensis]|uniref:cytochrome c oxidase assembly protein COX18, mitochondrial-like isoform X2 n=1 Tax=Varanus komodoensis TaxID=61221 RepID=UPI001CF7D3C4|nr:cytochrome c oxidase assembly protein COX18, mitochondrial-like isoform X2 [Varanus komodoensis]